MTTEFSNFKFEPFMESKDSWDGYQARFTQIHKIFGLKALKDEHKVVLFLHKMGPDINNTLKTQFHPIDLESIPLSDIMHFLERQYEPKKPLLVRQGEFQGRIPQQAERAEQYLITLL
ncbi:hypothetical protein RF11_07801 [Thelohanellus kitauei]|uniref:Uncharacterized protein n=1 Tax=Thelohanellus kitauei TaxID=669202 RepID=A0A0C2NK71_THEKT|nr:hypothetical protein RF11_07801 [Thelohanellus kitauei]